MLNLDSKEYDLNTLFSFEVLKEILLKLARGQDKLENDVRNMKQNISNRIIKLEQTIFNTSENENDFNQDEYQEEENLDEGEGKNEEGKTNNEFIDKGSDNNQNKDNKINDDENKSNEKDKEIEKKEDKDINISKKEYEKSNDIKDGEKPKIIDEQKDSSSNFTGNLPVKKSDDSEKKSSEKIKEKSVNQNKNVIINKQFIQKGKDQSGTYVSPELISKISKQLKEQGTRLNILDNKLQSETKNIKNIEKQLKNHTLDNESQFNLINERINSLLQQNEEYQRKIEDLQVKTSELDVFSMFKDSGDGTIDATKVMVKALEEKVFKKFELVDARYKKDALDSLKMKTNVENITPKLDQFNRELERINDINKQQKEDLDSYKKESEEQNLDNFNNITNDFNQRLNDLKNEMDKNIRNKLLLLENQLKNMKSDSKDNNNAFDLLKLSLGNNGLDSEAAQSLEKKISDLRKKVNDLENTLKLYMSEGEIDNIKNELKDMKLLLDKKITKDDLKELYNFHLSHVDELNDIKDREAMSFDELRKTIKDVQNIQQRIESINGNLSLLQNSPSNGNMKIIDFSKFIDNQKLTDSLKPFFKEFEKVFKEIDSFRRDINEIDSQCKNNIKNSQSKMEEDMNTKITEIKDFNKKRYLEKMEFNKTVKSLEVQIKSLGEDPKKSDADSWLLAKRPLKCFNCASCEANIKNENYNTADFLPWKKYPRGEKIHRMGQGFSHMLQMMTSEFIKSIEKSEFPLEYESAKNTNNLSNINERAGMSGFIINNKEQIQDDGFPNLKKNSKMILPKVKQYSKPKIRRFDEALPISDDEYTDNNNEINKDTIPASSSPKILKITKKYHDKMNNKFMNGNLKTMQGGFSTKDINFGMRRNSNIMKTEKNEFKATLTTSPKN